MIPIGRWPKGLQIYVEKNKGLGDSDLIEQFRVAILIWNFYASNLGSQFLY